MNAEHGSGWWGGDNPSRETRAFVFLLTLLGVLFGQLVRLRIHVGIALQAPQPAPFFFVGLIQDITVFAGAAGLTLAGAHWKRAEGFLKVAFAIFTLLVNLLQVARSEVVIFLGGAIRPEDLGHGLPLAVAARSILSGPGLILLVCMMILLALMGLGWHRAGHWRVPRPGARVWLVTFIIAGLTSYFTTTLPRALLARNALISIAEIQHESYVSAADGKSAVVRPALPELTVRELVPPSPLRRYVEPQYPLAYRPADQPSVIAIKPNIVFILVETLRAEEVGCYGADPPGVTPNIDALARDGIRVEPAYSSGTYTPSGELALWYGVAPLPREILLSSRPDVTMTGFPEILKAAGWKTFIWIHNGDDNFYGRARFYPRRGIQTVDGRSFLPTDPRTNWGFSDRALARNAIKVLDRVQEPFVSMILTVTNHHPFDLPSDAGPLLKLPPRTASSGSSFPGSETILGNRTPGMIQTVHYSDEAVGDFMRAAKKEPWYKRTIFVITGDHGSAMAPYGREVTGLHDLFEIRHKVPLIFYSPLLPGGRTIQGPATHLDVLPTILAAAGVNLPRAGIGADLFDPRLSKDRIVAMWSTHGRILTLASGKWYYHARYPGAERFENQSPVENLIDRDADPTGKTDLMSHQPELVARFRSAARVYLTVYPWLIVSGRSGVPPEMLPKPPRE